MRLYPYQRVGAEWLANRTRACLADEMGVGKTVTSIAALDKAGATHALVIAPTSVIFNWRHEFELWSPWRSVHVISSSAEAVIPARCETVVVTHGLLLSPRVRLALASRRWDAVILDESHFFRNPGTKRTAAFYGTDGITSNADRVWCLTGTPMPNHAAELWTMLRGLWPDQFHEGFRKFRAKYCKTRPHPFRRGDVKVVGNRNTDELRGRITGLFLKRTTAEVLPELPAIRHEQVNVRPTKMPTEMAELEAELAPTLARKLTSTERASHPGCRTVRDVVESAVDAETAFRLAGKHEDFSRWRRLCGLAKVGPVADLIATELDSGLEKIVLFAHHAEVVERLVDELAKFGARQITGATPPAERTANVLAFQNSPDVRVIVCNIVAGGTGTTLTAACETTFVEMSFVPGENAQAAKRVHRLGQTRACRVRFIALDGTLDEPLVGVLRNKTAGIREVMGP